MIKRESVKGRAIYVNGDWTGDVFHFLHNAELQNKKRILSQEYPNKQIIMMPMARHMRIRRVFG